MQLPNNIDEIMGNMPPQMMQNLQGLQGFPQMFNNNGGQGENKDGGMGGLGD